MKRGKQEVLERTSPSIFLTLFNNAVKNTNHLVQKLLRGTHWPTDRQKVNPSVWPFKYCSWQKSCSNIFKCQKTKSSFISQHANANPKTIKLFLPYIETLSMRLVYSWPWSLWCHMFLYSLPCSAAGDIRLVLHQQRVHSFYNKPE
jgi:hypothetical protein